MVQYTLKIENASHKICLYVKCETFYSCWESGNYYVNQVGGQISQAYKTREQKLLSLCFNRCAWGVRGDVTFYRSLGHTYSEPPACQLPYYVPRVVEGRKDKVLALVELSVWWENAAHQM